MIWALLHRLGLHRWRYVFAMGSAEIDGTSFNRYYECDLCGQRKVVLGVGGYQPVADWWLAGKDQPPPIVPPQGGSGLPAR